ncbi:MAG: penicillin-binding protein 2 [Deltaproteobacteria bacterium]|nr:penicillin-binding protein 2 [Deltaproteobacteria bacterium]
MSDTYLKTVDSDWYRQRLSGALIFVVAAFLVLLARLYYLQIVRGEDYRRQSQNNWVRLQSIPPPRGLIFDRNGTLLVDNRPSFSVSIVREDAKDARAVALRLADFLKEDEQSFLSKLDKAGGWPSFKPIVLKRDLSRNAVAVVESHKLDLPGIVISIEPMRHYIHGELASHLIGYLSEISEEQLKSGRYPDHKSGDFIGKFGVEKSYESFFHGRPGRRKVQVNAIGQIIRVLETMEAEPGKNVFLTLDAGLQRKTEALLAGKVGAAVALDPSNGHVLAMASRPAFDPNAFVEGMTFDAWNTLVSNAFHPMSNKAIQGQYPPGSTFKIVTAMAALEEGLVTRETRFYCPGYYRYGNRTYRCWSRHGHGSVDLVRAMAESCDVYFFQLGEKLGIDRLARYATACGLGQKTGVALANEALGLVPTSSWKFKKTGVPWQAGETLSVAIGQGFNLVTPLQMCCLIAAVGNGGILYRPVVVSRIEDGDGSLVKEIPAVARHVLPATKATLECIKQGLIDAVNQRRGTGWIVHLNDIKIAGKTGTAQVVSMEPDRNQEKNKERPLRLRDHAWFVAFAPAVSPKIAVTVLIEHGGHGASAAGPIAREMIRAFLKG